MFENISRIQIAGVTLVILGLTAYYFLGGDTASISTPSTDTITQAQPAAEEQEESLIRPAFDLVRISRGGTGVIAGRMTPGATIELLANNTKIAEVVADENGEWVMILEEPLDAGSVELNLIGMRPGQDDGIEAENVVVVSVPERDNSSLIERTENGVVAVLSPKSGEGASRVLQKPGVAAFAEVGESLSLETIDYGDGGEPVITGRSLPRVDVRLYMDDHFIGSTKADDNGHWSIHMAGQTLLPGDHIIRVDQTMGEGQVQLRIEQPFQTGLPLDTSAATSGVIIRPGNTLWQIARQLYGHGVRYTLIFRENSEQIKDPDLIYPGQLFRLPVADNRE